MAFVDRDNGCSGMLGCFQCIYCCQYLLQDIETEVDGFIKINETEPFYMAIIYDITEMYSYIVGSYGFIHICTHDYDDG